MAVSPSACGRRGAADKVASRRPAAQVRKDTVLPDDCSTRVRGVCKAAGVLRLRQAAAR